MAKDKQKVKMVESPAESSEERIGTLEKALDYAVTHGKEIEEGSEMTVDGKKMKVAIVNKDWLPHKVVVHLENTE